MTVAPTIRDLTAADWPAVAAIYADGIASGNATFETEVPTWQTWDAAHGGVRLVADDEGKVVGWATLTPVSSRCCYRGVGENSVYVAERARGRGVGRLLLERLVERAAADGFWTIEAGIFPENAASVALHVACGFRIVGTRERLGEMNGVWRDVLLLERRGS
jgi:phosphinothricin acetyltransferase